HVALSTLLPFPTRRSSDLSTNARWSSTRQPPSIRLFSVSWGQRSTTITAQGYARLASANDTDLIPRRSAALHRFHFLSKRVRSGGRAVLKRRVGSHN